MHTQTYFDLYYIELILECKRCIFLAFHWFHRVLFIFPFNMIILWFLTTSAVIIFEIFAFNTFIAMYLFLVLSSTEDETSSNNEHLSKSAAKVQVKKSIENHPKPSTSTQQQLENLSLKPTPTNTSTEVFILIFTYEI